MVVTTTPRRAYPSDMSDARWALIEPMLSQWRAARGRLAISDPKHELREIVNAIAYLDRTGIGWEYMPHDFPPAKTVYYYFALWRDDATIEHIHDALRDQVREAAGAKSPAHRGDPSRAEREDLLQRARVLPRN